MASAEGMGTELCDNKGLICGFRLQSLEVAAEIEWTTDSPPDPAAGPLWLHFNLNDARARAWLEQCPWLAPEALEFLIASDHAIGFDLAGDGVVGKLADQHADEPDTFGILRLYVDATCLITGRHHPLAAPGRLHAELIGGAKLDTPAALLNRLLEHLVAILVKSVAEDADSIDDAEDRILTGDCQHAKLARHRREMVRLRRQVFANRHALEKSRSASAA